MRSIMENQLNDMSRGPAKTAEVIRPFRKFFRKYFIVLLMGAASIGLYATMYFFNADLEALVKETLSGNKSLFFVPILIAFVFSFIHGAFTSKFWDVLGIKAKKK